MSSINGRFVAFYLDPLVVSEGVISLVFPSNILSSSESESESDSPSLISSISILLLSSPSCCFFYTS
jgi:hypothetical protein